MRKAVPASVDLDSMLLPVGDVAQIVLGRAVCQRTILRWVISGRAGHRLPALRGVRRQHVCTVPTFRRWIAETSGQTDVAQGFHRNDAAADAALAAMGIGGGK